MHHGNLFLRFFEVAESLLLYCHKHLIRNWAIVPKSSRGQLTWEIKVARVFWTLQKKVSKILSPIQIELF